MKFSIVVFLVIVLLSGCTNTEVSFNGNHEQHCDEKADLLLPYAVDIVLFTPGEGAGYGQEQMPDVVLGPPSGRGKSQGAQNVLSLGAFGEIIVSFGERLIVDGPGDDFIVFENAFWPAGNASDVFAELGEVSVSMDGDEWHTFACNTQSVEVGMWPGCAGWIPTESYNACAINPIVPETVGGNGFDLDDLGIEKARYVRIRDVSGSGAAPSAGFDLDAVGIIHSSTQY